jgi:hypothetical protein
MRICKGRWVAACSKAAQDILGLVERWGLGLRQAQGSVGGWGIDTLDKNERVQGAGGLRHAARQDVQR